MEPSNLTFLVAGGCVIVVGQLGVALIGYFRERMKQDKLSMVVAEQMETKHELNSRLTELVEAVRLAARASGILEGKAQQRKLDQRGDDSAAANEAMSEELAKIGASHAATGTGHQADALKHRERKP
jgi:hypothetical protein